jgi:beta,beta-carotene 9',10'-dioxygenase
MTTQTAVTADYRLGFTTQDREVSVDQLPVTGALPRWLTGSLVRTGPAKFEVGERSYNHWFDGLAMLHRFGFGEGRVSYVNRFLRTRAYREAEKTGRISYAEFATDPCRTLFQRVVQVFDPRSTDNASVNVMRLGDEYVAMTETPLPVAFEPETLRTLGVADWASGLPGQLTTAHPHYDDSTGEMVNYVTHFAPASKYRLYALKPGAGKPREIASVPARKPAYMHSFALTERYAVLVEYPLVVNPPSLALSRRPFIENYRWEPDRGTTFTVIDRHAGAVERRVQGPPFFCFHHVNAFESGDELVIDLAAYEDASIVQALYLKHLRAGPSPIRAELRRYRVPLGSSGDVSGERLADGALELPRIDYRTRNTRPYRYVYGDGMRGGDSDFLDQLVKVDVDSGDVKAWSEDGCYPGEPVFVPAPDQRSEDDGVILSVVLDARAESSFLVVLDASSFEEIARALAPLRIPFGFHGSYFRGE